MSADGFVSHVTNIQFTGAIPENTRAAAWCRIVCLYVVGRLDDNHIKEACENLSDIFKMQTEAEMVQEPEEPIMRSFTSTPRQLGNLW
jgi:hypothetical protein